MSDSPSPLLCQTSLGGAIDPDIYLDQSGAWLLWKNDGNCCGEDVSIWSQQLDVNSLELVGEATKLLAVDRPLGVGGHRGARPRADRQSAHALLFRRSYADESYGVGYRAVRTVSAPCLKASRFPLLSTLGGVVGPGGESVFQQRRQVLGHCVSRLDSTPGRLRRRWPAFAPNRLARHGRQSPNRHRTDVRRGDFGPRLSAICMAQAWGLASGCRWNEAQASNVRRLGRAVREGRTRTPGHHLSRRTRPR